MAIYPIRTFGDPVLRIRAEAIADLDAGIRKLATDMIETMHDAPGVGLAAPQIGVAKRIFVFDIQDQAGTRVVINPELLETAGEAAMEEGCLSVPNRFWPVTRPAFARVRGLDLEGNEVIHEGEELLGRVLQHEFDHLEGMLVLERLPNRQRKEALKELREEALGLRPRA
ncbi:MAG TPA: peptide deformylase [Acidimicrobiia bacterium]